MGNVGEKGVGRGWGNVGEGVEKAEEVYITGLSPSPLGHMTFQGECYTVLYIILYIILYNNIYYIGLRDIIDR